MKKELHIIATLPETIKPCKQHFSVLYPKMVRDLLNLLHSVIIFSTQITISRKVLQGERLNINLPIKK